MASFWSQFILVAIAATTLRLYIISIMPSEARAFDFDYALKSALVMEQGIDPQAAGFLHYAPFYMLFVFAFREIALALNFQLVFVMRMFLIFNDVLLIGLSAAILWHHCAQRRFGRLLLIGLALNPVVVLLTCQQGNLDGILATLVLAFVLAYITFLRTHHDADLYLSCFFLGLGILLKTVPVVLIPLIFSSAKQWNAKKAFLCALLTLGPTVYGLAIIFSLHPAAIIKNVLSYRSRSGWYGFPGILGLLRQDWLVPLADRISPLLFLALICGMSVQLFKVRTLIVEELLSLAAALLVAVPLIGMGYGPQYAFWYVPLLVLHYPSANSTLKKFYWTWMAVAGLTYIVEFGFFFSHGAFVYYLWPQKNIWALVQKTTSQQAQTLIRLPLFILSLCFCIYRIRRIWTMKAS